MIRYLLKSYHQNLLGIRGNLFEEKEGLTFNKIIKEVRCPFFLIIYSSLWKFYKFILTFVFDAIGNYPNAIL